MAQVYSVVSQKQTEAIRRVIDQPALREAVKQIFSLQEGGKHEIMADFYCNICNFARKHEFSNEQLSLLLGLMGASLKEALQQRMPRESCAQYFSAALAKQSLHRPPYSIEVFNPAQEQIVLTFFKDSLYRHFDLYEVLFTPHSNITIATAKRFPNDIPHPLSLIEGSVVDPSTLPFLAEYIAAPRQATPVVVQEAPETQEQEEEEEQDEITLLLNAEVAKLKHDLDERMKSQEDELLKPFRGKKK